MMSVIHMDMRLWNQYMKEDKPVLVKFWASCGEYCQCIARPFEKIAEQMGDTCIVAAVNVDEEQALAQQEQIEIVPTLVLYQNGKAIGSIVAPESKIRIEKFIHETLPDR